MLRKNSLNLAVIAVMSGVPLAANAQQDQSNVTILDTIEIVGKQDSYFEDHNTTALKGETAESETPFLVSIINQTLIEDIRADRLEDVLDYTTGVTRSGYLADGFVIRGFDIDLSNIKVDGMSGLVSRFGSPSTYNVESIEVLKGPASVLYGNMETGGMVNITTKQPQSEAAASLQISAQTYATDVSEFASDNGVTTTLDLTGPVKGQENLSYRFIASGEQLNSFRKNVDFENYYLAPSLLWEDDNNSLLLSLEVTKENGSADHGLFAAQQDISTVASIDTVYQEESDFDNDEGIALGAHYTRILNDESEFTFKWRSVWHNDERRMYENNSVRNVDLSAGESISDTTLRRRLRHQTNDLQWHGFDSYIVTEVADKHQLTFGLAGEYRMTNYERIAFGSAGNVSPDVSIYDPELGGTAAEVAGSHRETQYYSAGLYAQDKMSVTDKLTVVGAARVNHTKIDFSCISGSCTDTDSNTTDVVGSLGAVYQITDQWSVYANSAQSFDPTTAERVDINGNALDAEESTQVEFGVKYGISDRLNATAATYKIRKKNVAEKVNGEYENIAEVESKGIELDLQWLPNSNWQIKAGYAYNNTEIAEGANKGLTPAHAPRRSAYAFSRYNLGKRVLGGEVGFSVAVNYQDDVKTDASPDNSVTLPSYTTLGLAAFYEREDWKWALNVENAADKEYFYAGSDDERIYVGDPRKLTLTVTKAF